MTHLHLIDILHDARHEVGVKSRSQIEEETAYKWAARAIVAYETYVRTQRPKYMPSAGSEVYLRDAGDYYHEAIEHAALADESGDVLRDVREFVYKHVQRGVL